MSGSRIKQRVADMENLVFAQSPRWERFKPLCSHCDWGRKRRVFGPDRAVRDPRLSRAGALREGGRGQRSGSASVGDSEELTARAVRSPVSSGSLATPRTSPPAPRESEAGEPEDEETAARIQRK